MKSAAAQSQPNHRKENHGEEIELSVVVPLLNEVQNVIALHDSLTRVLSAHGKRYEILFIDDGSTDGTRDALRRLASTDPHLRVFLFRKNFGQTAAMAQGFTSARGRQVVSMDGDLQNDPTDIPRLLERLDAGFDIVCGWRRHRKDAVITRLLPSMLANQLIRWATGVPIHDTGCSLKAYRSWVVRNLNLYSDMHRFIAALGAGLGARITEVPVRHHPRRYGRSKYGLSRVLRVVLDLIGIKMLIQFSAHPIRWFGILSLPLVFAGTLLALIAVVKLDHGTWEFIADYDNLYMSGAAIVALLTLNVFMLGFLAELQSKATRFFGRRIGFTASESAR